MKSNVNDVLRDAEEQLENSNALLYIGVAFVILTSLFLAYHSWHLFFRLAGGESEGKGAYLNAYMAVGCVEGSLIALIICHFALFTTNAQKWIGLLGDAVTYAILLFHAALNFRQNLFGYLDGFGEIYQSNGLPVIVFGATLGTWTAILLLDIRAKMRIKTMATLSATRERELKATLRDRVSTAPVAGFARSRHDERGDSSPKSESSQD